MATADPKPESPPMLAGRIQGVRAWTLLGAGASGDPLLGSMASSSYWPPDRPLKALCNVTESGSAHAAPESGCGCGIYAWHPSRAAESMEVLGDAPWQEGEVPNAVAGVIEAWGRIEVHWEGFRAEHARPVALFADPGGSPQHRRVIEALADSYRADVVQVADVGDLEAYCRALPGKLGPRALEELLAPEVTVTLERGAVGYLSGRERDAIAGSGYVMEGHEPPDRWRPQLEVDLPGVRIARVAGPSFHPHALQDRAFDPGRPVRLLPERHNRHDPNAIGVWDERLRLQAGYVPAKLAPEVGRLLGEGRLKVGISLWQWRDLDSGERIGLHILLSASDRVAASQGEGRRSRAISELSMVDEDIDW